MIVGIPREVKNHEYRVASVPAGVRDLLADVLPGRLTVLASNACNLEKARAETDLVVGALLTPGAKARKVVLGR